MCLSKVWNGYISPRLFVPNLHSKVHTVWENTTRQSLSVSSSNEISHHQQSLRQGYADRLQSNTQSLPVGDSEHNRVRHCQEKDLSSAPLCFLPIRRSGSLRKHLFHICKCSQSSFSSWAHDDFCSYTHRDRDVGYLHCSSFLAQEVILL